MNNMVLLNESMQRGWLNSMKYEKLAYLSHVFEGSVLPVYEAASLSDQFPTLLRKRAFRSFGN